MTSQRRRGVGLLALILGFVGMGVLLVLQNESLNNPPAEATVEPVVRDQEVFPELSSGDISAIRLADPNGNTYMDFALDVVNRWTLPSYPDEQLNQETMTYIARTIAVLPYQHAFDLPAESDLQQYGFYADGSHYFSVQFVTLEGEQHFIAIGNPVEDTSTPSLLSTFYAIVDDREEMYLVPQAAIFYLVEHMVNPPVE